MGFCDGYKKSQEKFKYTEEDLRKAMKYASEITNNKMKYMEDYIQSLSQPKMPNAFECAMKSIPCPDNNPDCIVCHMGIMTTTTPEGHTQWVGTYIY